MYKIYRVYKIYKFYEVYFFKKKLSVSGFWNF